MPRSVRGVCDALGAGRQAGALGGGQTGNHLERPPLLCDAVDAPPFAVEHQDVLWRHSHVSETAGTFPGRQWNGRQHAARDELQLMQRRRRRPAGRAHDPQVAFDRVNLKCRHFVEAGVDAGEARQAARAFAHHEKTAVLGVSDDEAAGDCVVPEADGSEAWGGEDERPRATSGRLRLRINLLWYCNVRLRCVSFPWFGFRCLGLGRGGFGSRIRWRSRRGCRDVLRRRSRHRAGLGHRFSAERRFELRPAGQCSYASEVVARCRVSDDTHRRQSPQHHERIARSAAETLRSRKHRHQRRIVFRTRLQRAPREVMECVVVLACGGVERQLPTSLPFAALLTGRRRVGCGAG